MLLVVTATAAAALACSQKNEKKNDQKNDKAPAPAAEQAPAPIPRAPSTAPEPPAPAPKPPVPKPPPSVQNKHERITTASAACPATRLASTGKRQPDIILITIDTLRADRLGTYGHKQARTPHMDALAAQGVRFDNATTPMPRTTPAMASMLTGLAPAQHGSREVGNPILHGVSLATQLCEAGYATIGLSGTPVLSPEQQLHQGFDQFINIKLAIGHELTQRALLAVSEVPAELPLFLWVHYVDPHYEYLPPARFQPQPKAQACRKLMAKVAKNQIRRGALYGNHGGVAKAALSHCKALYDAEIAYADTELGALLGGLRERGRLAGAHVILSSDHGENLGESQLYYEHGPSVHDASLRIPLVWSGPGLAAGHVVKEAPVQLQDIPPTLLALIGRVPEPPPAWDGKDLSALLRGAPEAAAQVRTMAFAEGASALLLELYQYVSTGRARGYHCINNERYALCRKGGELVLYDVKADPALKKNIRQQRAKAKIASEMEQAWTRWPPEEARERTVRTSRFKLVEYPQYAGGYRQALYDLQRDPGETRNVIKQFPELAGELSAALHAWAQGARRSGPAKSHDAETAEALRALGYTE